MDRMYLAACILGVDSRCMVLCRTCLKYDYDACINTPRLLKSPSFPTNALVLYLYVSGFPGPFPDDSLLMLWERPFRVLFPSIVVQSNGEPQRSVAVSRAYS